MRLTLHVCVTGRGEGPADPPAQGQAQAPQQQGNQQQPQPMARVVCPNYGHPALRFMNFVDTVGMLRK